MTRVRWLLAVVGAIVAAALIALALPPPEGFRGWLTEQRDGDADWGWDLLSTEAQRAYGGRRADYDADMAAVDWSALLLGMPVDVWSDDGFVSVQAELRSGPETVPAFLFDRRIVRGVCDNGRPTGIGVFEDRRPFQGGKFDGGGVTGSQARCNAAFGSRPCRVAMPASFGSCSGTRRTATRRMVAGGSSTPARPIRAAG